MREEIANLVYPVLAHGMDLKARLEAGSRPNLDLEQMELKRLLGSEMEARRLSDYGGDSVMGLSVAAPRAGGGGARGTDPFLGIRYALVCWLDELFILDSSWSTEWNERKLEAALYGTNDRAWRFWDQAKRAETQPGSDALEVFFLCVMLGFRGDLREEPTRLQAWVAGTQIRVAKSQAQEWVVPPELQPPTNVPPLRGRERLQRMVVIAGVILLILIPVTTVLLVIHYSSP
ncbi:MAG TPA: DotU family type IV/VI secretion system protein [Gemmataceae bacterium]|jgi:type VI secretion system protein ImpK